MNLAPADDLPTPTARTYAFAAAVVVAFTVYGSFVPFRFEPHTWTEALALWDREAMTLAFPNSKTDWLVNVLLGVPLGYCLLAAVRSDKPGPTSKTLLAGLLLWPACVLLALGVEFGQLFFHRTASISDVCAQSLGSLVGILSFTAYGAEITAWARSAWSGQRVGGTAGKLLAVYLGLLLLALMMPLDLLTTPGELWRDKWKDGKITLLPFNDPFGPDRWQKWIELFGLFVPAGLFLSARGGVWRAWQSAPWVFAAGVGVAAVAEVLQLLVRSRFSSTTDALIGGLGVLAGWAVGRAVAIGRAAAGLDLHAALILGQAWWLLLLAAGWHPFHFDRSLGRERLQQVEWVPLLQAEQKNPLFALEDAAVKILLAAPLGALAAAVGVGAGGWTRLARAVAVAAGCAVVVEAGQLFLIARYAGPTDVLYAALGGWLGGVAVQRLRANAAWKARIRSAASVPELRLPTVPSVADVHLPPSPFTLLPPDDVPIHVRLAITDFDPDE